MKDLASGRDNPQTIHPGDGNGNTTTDQLTSAGVLKNLDLAQLHTELHGLISMPADENSIRDSFRQRAMTYLNAVGVAHLTLQEDGIWDLKPGHSSGRVPRRHDFLDTFAKSCKSTFERQTVQMESFLGLTAVFLPVSVAGANPEIMLVLTADSETSELIFLAEIILEYFTLWLKEKNTNDNAWKLTSLAALIELMSAIESSSNRQEAALTVANELQRYLGCAHVAVGILRGRKLVVEAVSGETKVERSGRFYQTNEAVLNEARLRNSISQWNCQVDNHEHLLLAHRQLAEENRFSNVISTPLTTPSGEFVGSLVLGVKPDSYSDLRCFNFIRAAGPRIASSIDVVRRSERSGLIRWMERLKNSTGSIKGQVGWGGAAIVIACLCLPVPYRVRCGCEVVPNTLQLSVSPFDGLIKNVFADEGDLVEAGQVLAEMDGREIDLRLNSVSAELAKAEKKRDIALNQGKLNESLLSDLDAKSLHAEQKLLRDQKSRVRIRSSKNGILIRSHVDDGEGAALSKGDKIFEVADLSDLIIEVNIPAEEIGHVEVGQPARVWIDGFESKSIFANLMSLAPTSEIKDGRNVIVAELKLINNGFQYRPGMKGHVRIDTANHPLFWNLFHKPSHFISSRLIWW